MNEDYWLEQRYEDLSFVENGNTWNDLLEDYQDENPDDYDPEEFEVVV